MTYPAIDPLDPAVAAALVDTLNDVAPPAMHAVTLIRYDWLTLEEAATMFYSGCADQLDTMAQLAFESDLSEAEAAAQIADMLDSMFPYGYNGSTNGRIGRMD